MKNFIILIIASFLFPLNSFAVWNEVDCSSINKKLDLLNNNYSPQRCWRSIGDVTAYAGDYDDGQNYVWFEFQEIMRGNSVWGSDYAFDNLKNDKLINTISNYGLGSNPSIDTKISTLTSNNGKLKYFHKNFETSEGKGVIGGNTMGKLFYEFGFFTADKSANLNEDFISELLSSLKISWANKGVQTSINLSGGSGSGSSIQEFNSSATNKSNNSSSSSQSFIEMCKNSKLSDLDKDVALLCLEKID